MALGLLTAATPIVAASQHVDEEIIVTAVPGDRPTNELAQSVTVLGGEALDRARAVSLGETLERELGMSASWFGAAASRPIIRGLAGARVRTMEDGIDAMDVSTVSADHAVSIDPLVARQVEIFRGPTTLLYGSGAVGGVVNTVTNRIPEGAPEDGFDAAMELRGDSASDERTLAVAFDGGRSDFAWHFDAADRETGDYEIPGYAGYSPAAGETPGRLENSDLELTSYALGGSWFGTRSFIGLAVSGFDSDYGVPGPAADIDEEDVRIDLGQTRVDLKWGWTGMEGILESVSLRVGLSDYEHVELEAAEIGTRFANDAYESRLEFLHAPVGAWTGAFGLQLSERRFSAIGDEAFVPPVDSDSQGLFLVERLATGPWDLSVGARYEAQHHKPTGATGVDGSSTSVSAAAIRSLGDGRAVSFNFASAERLPVAEELFADGPHFASRSFEVGNPDLGSETSRHIDLGFRKSGGLLAWSVTAFVTRYDDFIYLQGTGEFDDDLPRFVFSQQDARFHGVEAELAAPVAEIGQGELDFRVFADFVRAKLDGGENVPRIPPLRYGARLTFHTDRLVMGLEVTEYEDQDDLAPFESPTAGYTLVSADLDWLVMSNDDRNLSVFVRGSNLLDQKARRHTSLVKDFAPLPGRNYAFGFRGRF